MRIIILGLIVLSFVALGWMLLAYIPQYIKMFNALCVKLPMITVVMLTLSQFIQSNLIIAIVVISIAIGALHYSTKESNSAFIIIGSLMVIINLGLIGLGYLAVQVPINELKAAIGGS